MHFRKKGITISRAAHQCFEKWGATGRGTLSIIYQKFQKIVWILKPADDIAASGGEKSYCHFKVSSPWLETR